MPLAQVMMSGSSPKRPLANHAPHRPNPVITSSATNSTPVSRHTARAADRYPWGAGYTPPAPITGSQKNAATLSSPTCSIIERRSSASSQRTCTTSSISSPWPAAFAGIPARLVPAVCIPWYARSRRIRIVRSGCPTSCQNRRAIFVAVSIESEPPLVRNTRLSETGASELTRSASSDAGRFERSPNVEYAGSAVIWAAAASAMSRRPNPTLANQRPAVASR